LLQELRIDVNDFLSVPDSEPIDANVLHKAMLTITAATKSLFAKPRREFIVTRLQLKLYSVNTFSCDIISLVCDAIDRGLLKDLNLDILDETRSCDSSYSDMLKRAQEMDGFSRAYPTVLDCLTKLSLREMCFLQLDMHHILFDCCKQLKQLTLCGCDAGPRSLWKIDAPNQNSVFWSLTCVSLRELS
jgi:hypothetical protein